MNILNRVINKLRYDPEKSILISKSCAGYQELYATKRGRFFHLWRGSQSFTIDPLTKEQALEHYGKAGEVLVDFDEAFENELVECA